MESKEFYDSKASSLTLIYLGLKLRELRKKYDKDYKKSSKYVNITKRMLQHYERGVSTMSLHTLKELTNFYKKYQAIDINYFFDL